MTPEPRPSKTIGFTTLFLIELWERFGYYGMTAVVVLFMVQKVAYADDRANLTFVPAVGGWIGDKVLGSRRTTVLGSVVLAIGYSLLAVPNHPELPEPSSRRRWCR
jgi:proton-dependent oligopeptide transporter, POT family